MLTQTRQIRITLSNLESNIKTLLAEREQFVKEFQRLNKLNEDLTNQITKLQNENAELKRNFEKTTQEVPTSES
jgi:peptidoglycan hydrolase CwlO-like protein